MIRAIFDFINKTWYIFLIVIVWLVVDISGIFPRFGFFNKSSYEVINTPVIVEEIREINELITAEYYGEVYASLYEGYANLIARDSGDFMMNRKIKEKYPGFESFYTLKQQLKSAKNEKKELIGQLKKTRKEKNGNSIEKLQEKLEKAKSDISQAEDELSGLKDDRNLIYIGRGWVKAGFNFKSLEKADISVNPIKGTDSVSVGVPSPEILNTDINPWFIPKKKVKGYEVYMVEDNRTAFTDEEITLVKHTCKERLKSKAIEKNILSKASKNGKSVLGRFFGLLGFSNLSLETKKM